MEEKRKSEQLLDKVYAHLETIDVSKLSWDELKDFLEVVQKGQFLESYGQMSFNPWGNGNFIGYNQPTNCETESKDGNVEQ